MYTIFKDFSFAAAHAIRGHTRGCQNLHGHNYRVRVHLRARQLDRLGMVLDFADLKAMMQEILGPFDHQLLNDVPPFDQRNTTAELLAAYVHGEVSQRLAAALLDENDEHAEPSAAPASPANPEAPATFETPGTLETPETSGPPGRGAGRRRIEVTRVEVWENDTSCAAFEP